MVKLDIYPGNVGRRRESGANASIVVSLDISARIARGNKGKVRLSVQDYLEGEFIPSTPFFQLMIEVVFLLKVLFTFSDFPCSYFV